MTLAPGAQLGAYEIVGPVGAGGMGEVYRARDRRLNRDVAIKILPSLFAADPERLARFEREAQLLASLNHPNIAQIHGLEESGAVRALVMELVEGESLAARLSRGPIPVEEALTVAQQIAEALEAAHQRGIVHRDLKPANVVVRTDGTVKVLDFGLAKALMPSAEANVANSPTLTLAATEQGMVLGTAAYMAPEQAKGKPVDTRADIWAFGVVLFEMLTGRSLYSGETASEILARVIEREPDWSRLPPDTRAAVRHLLRRCLTKDPKHRLQSIGDARIEIEEALAAPTEPEAAPSLVRRRERLWTAIAVAALLAALVMAILLVRLPAPAAIGAPTLRAAIALPDGLYLDGVGPPEMALSRDGRVLAFLARGATGSQRLYVRKLDAAIATLVPGSETAEGPFFSPDGQWVAFAVGVSVLGGAPPELRKYSLATGLTQTICRVEDYFGGVWRADGSIIYVDRQPKGLWTVSSGGGQPRQLVPRFRTSGADTERAVAWPDLLPDGRSVVLTDGTASGIGSLATVNLDTRELTPLGLDGSGPRVLPNGYLVYAGASAALVGVRFDPRERRVLGAPVALLPDIAFGRGNVPVFALDGHGTLVFATGYLSGSRREPSQLIRATSSGHVTTLPFEPDLFQRGFALSPDGSRLAASTWDGSRWVLDLARGTRVKLPTAATSDVYSLVWSPDGRHLAVSGPAVASPLWGLFLQPTDGSSSFETIIAAAPYEIFAAGWTPDGRTLLGWRTVGSGGGTHILAIDAGQRPRVLVEEAGGIRTARVSPDGRWVAFDSTASGDFQVQVVAVSGPGQRVAVTANGGYAPRWSRDGRQLFYRRSRAVLAVDVTATGDAIHLGPERPLFEWDAAAEYEVGPQGDFYGVQPLRGVTQQTAIQLRTNWFAEVERRVGGAERPSQ